MLDYSNNGHGALQPPSSRVPELPIGMLTSGSAPLWPLRFMQVMSTSSLHCNSWRRSLVSTFLISASR